MASKCFSVVTKRGHCGSGNYTTLEFAIEARDAVEASFKAQKMPGVKHTEMPLSAKEISRQEFNELRKTSAYKRAEQFGGAT